MTVALEPHNAPQLLRSFIDRGFRFAQNRKMWEES
jgi:hypothetical protein